MGCMAGYCSNGSNVIISRDKNYTSTILLDILTYPAYSNKTNNKLSCLTSSRQENNEHINNFRNRHAFSNKELKIPDNPLPFVKIKPKKLLY